MHATSFSQASIMSLRYSRSWRDMESLSVHLRRNLGSKRFLGNQVNVASEQIFKPELEIEVSVKGSWAFKSDKNVQVAVGLLLTPSHRAEKRQARYPIAPHLRHVFPQGINDGISCHCQVSQMWQLKPASLCHAHRFLSRPRYCIASPTCSAWISAEPARSAL